MNQEALLAWYERNKRHFRGDWTLLHGPFSSLRFFFNKRKWNVV